MVKAKGSASDISGNLLNSSEERLERTPGVGSGRPWVDPTLKVHIRFIIFEFCALQIFDI